MNYFLKKKEQLQMVANSFQNKYKRLLNNLDVGIYTAVLQPNEKFIELNDQMLSIFEVESLEKMMEYSINEFCSEASKLIELTSQLIHFGFISKEKLKIITLKGNKKNVLFSASLYTDDNRLLYYDGVVEVIKDNLIIKK